jgi:hypothetical protein
VRAADVGRTLSGATLDQVGRVRVNPDLTIPGHPEVFVLGDMARFAESEGKLLPGVALVAMQEGIYAANIVRKEVQRGAIAERAPFRYHDLGQMATIGRSRAIAEFGRLRLAGLLRVVVLADRSYLSPQRFPQSPVGAGAVGVVVHDVRSRRATHRRQGMAGVLLPTACRVLAPSRSSFASTARSIGEGS